jgi:predicted metal-binding membrane protein
MALWINDSPIASICLSPSIGYFDGSIARLQITPLSSRLSSGYMCWLVMVAAMMLPLTILPVRHVAFRSFSNRRYRAISQFLLGYLMLWAVVGAAMAPLSYAIPPSTMGLSLALVVAVGWQLTPTKSRALLRCHRTVPLTPVGWRAPVDCLFYGLRTGADCALSCWALMLPSVIASHSLLIMLGCQTIMLHERYEISPRIRALISNIQTSP